MTIREALEIEVRTGNIILKELDKIHKRYALRATKWHAKQQEKFENIEYADIEEAREAWGMDFITKREFNKIERDLARKENLKCDADYVAEAIGRMITNEYLNLKYAESELKGDKP